MPIHHQTKYFTVKVVPKTCVVLCTVSLMFTTICTKLEETDLYELYLYNVNKSKARARALLLLTFDFRIESLVKKHSQLLFSYSCWQ